MILKNFGAIGLLLSVFLGGCDNAREDLYPVDGLNGEATAKYLMPGSDVGDCLGLTVTGDTAVLDSGFGTTEAWCIDGEPDGFYDVDVSDLFNTGCLCIVSGTPAGDYVQVYESTVILEDCNDDDDTVGSASITAYADTDADGYGNPSSSLTVCGPSSGWVTDNTDCDDTVGTINPGAIEACDSVDNDCDSSVDESGSTGESTWYADTDADSFGNVASSQSACSQPSGYVSDATDCDDADEDINPSGLEVCDSVDNDCDSLTDDADSGLLSWTGSQSWPDGDNDGYGDENGIGLWTCVVPSGYVGSETDCDDSESSINPGAAEIADDGVDQDCSGSDEVTVDVTNLVCVTPISETDECSLFLTNYTLNPWTPADPYWYPYEYANGVGEICGEFPVVSLDDLKVNVECVDSVDGHVYWGWQYADATMTTEEVTMDAMTIGGTDVFASVVFTGYDDDEDGTDDGADGIVEMP